MSDTSPRVHDRFFKQIFSRPENVRDFIRLYVPADVVAHLDLDELEVVNGNFIHNDLAEYFSDIVVKTRVTQGQPADLYFLFEHKSGPERFARIQMLQYMASSWSAALRDGSPTNGLPLVIPVLIHHGARKWSYSLAFEDLFQAPSAAFTPYIPKFEHILHDISHVDESELRGTIVLQTVQLLLKYIQTPQLRERLPEILGLLGRLSEKERVTEYLQVVLEYIFQAAEYVETADLRQAVQTLPQGESIMPTIAEKLRAEGQEQGLQMGREEGIQKGMQQGELQGKQRAVIRQMQRKFTLSPTEEAFIAGVQDQTKLDNALETILFAQDKSEVLQVLSS